MTTSSTHVGSAELLDHLTDLAQLALESAETVSEEHLLRACALKGPPSDNLA